MTLIRPHHLGTAQVDHGVLRQVSAIVATLPVMTEAGFKDEFLTVSWFQGAISLSLILLIGVFRRATHILLGQYDENSSDTERRKGDLFRAEVWTLT